MLLVIIAILTYYKANFNSHFRILKSSKWLSAFGSKEQLYLTFSNYAIALMINLMHSKFKNI